MLIVEEARAWRGRSKDHRAGDATRLRWPNKMVVGPRGTGFVWASQRFAADESVIPSFSSPDLFAAGGGHEPALRRERQGFCGRFQAFELWHYRKPFVFTKTSARRESPRGVQS